MTNISTEYSPEGIPRAEGESRSEQGRVVSQRGATYPVDYAYDEFGEKVSMTTYRDVNAAGVTTFLYDDFGSLTNETVVGVAGTNTIERFYDNFGRDAGYAINGIRQSTLAYDPATGRLASMQTGRTGVSPVPNEVPFTWSYLPGSDLKSSPTYPNGLTASWTYDANGQLLQVCNATPTNVISQYDYVYDAAGCRINVSKSGTAFNHDDTIAYGYNEKSELTNAVAAVDSAYRYAYDFDDIGNRESSSERGTNTFYAANQLNQYTSISNSVHSASPREKFIPLFDDDGNQTLVKTATGIWDVTYNGENRPVRWVNGDTVLTMSYDRMGRRVTKNGHCFIYDEYLQVADNADSTYIWDPTESVATRPLAWDRCGFTAYYAHDGNKNVSEAVAENGDIAAHYAYAPFGAVIAKRGASAAVNPWRFSSEYAEDDIATVYYNYRHYEPVMGRWLSRDPIDEKGGELLYVYSGNSLRIDRLGMSWMDWKDLIPGPINTILSAKDCVISLYNWSLGVKEHVKDAYNDKYLHCRASCEFSQDCGTKISAALGVIKEVGDLLGHTFELIRDLFDDSNTVGEDFEWYLKWLADSGTDLLADGEGIACEWSGSDCECCCAESHDRYTERKK